MNNRNFIFLDNLPSDAGFIAFGKSIEDLFRNSALALFEIIADRKRIKKQKSINIIVEADNYEDLLYNFLSEILAQSEINEVFFRDLKLKISEENNKKILSAELYGDDFNEEIGRNLVKAITLHDFSIKKDKNRYEATVYVDL